MRGNGGKLRGRLISLGLSHAEALELFLAEFDAVPDQLHGYFCEREWPISQVVDALEAWARGEQLPSGWVPCSTWFWEQEGVLQGVINVRHRLTPGLEEVGGHIGYCVAPSHRRQGVATRQLGAVLAAARGLGLSRALLTCDRDNPGSWKAIEANGGSLQREGWCASEQRLQRWYWIHLDRVDG